MSDECLDRARDASASVDFERAGRRWQVLVAKRRATITIAPLVGDGDVRVLTGYWSGRRLRGFPELGTGLRALIALDLRRRITADRECAGVHR